MPIAKDIDQSQNMQAPQSTKHRILWNSCNVNCGSRCALRVHVENTPHDGTTITRIESDTTGDDAYGQHQLRACPRGRAMRQLVYAQERLLYPMKRVVPRGQCAHTDPAKQIEEGQFVRISWEQAYDEIAAKLHTTLDKYGNESIFIAHGSGSRSTVMGQSWPVESSPIGRLMNTMGGYLGHYADYSSGQITMGMAAQFGGDWAYGSALSTMCHSELAVFFGQNPSETRMSGSKMKTLLHATQNKTRTIIIDPRYSDTMVSVGSEWIPIRPSTDAALCSALAYVMITEGLIDIDFIGRYTIGYDEDSLPIGAPTGSSYKSYILGLGHTGDSGDSTSIHEDYAVPKTPQWAAPITGIPAERIITLAREIAAAKPCFISQGWGPQRTTHGEDACRAIAMLAILTGNIGIAGGNTGAREYNGMSLPMAAFPIGENPIKTKVSHFNWYEAIDKDILGTVDNKDSMTSLNAGVRHSMVQTHYPTDQDTKLIEEQEKDIKLTAPIKFIWNYAGNSLTNQHGGINQMHRILADETKCETIVVMDTHMTASARYADYILPCCTTLEAPNWAMGLDANMGFAVFDAQCIEPLGESKAIYDICTGVTLAMDKLNKSQAVRHIHAPTSPVTRTPAPSYTEAFTEGRTHLQWLEHLYAQSQGIFAEQGLPPLPPSLNDAFQQGIYRHHFPQDYIAYEAFRRDPIANPLDTPSGKIEIYSSTFAHHAATWSLAKDQYISPIPEYRHDPEGAHSPLQNTYPLQLIGHHYKQRTHSNFGTCAWLQEVAPQMLWMNPLDATERSIKHGDMVKVYNDRGATLVPVKVTPRIMPRVVSLPQGAWHQPENGKPTATDINGCVNVLTSLQPTALSKSNPHHSNLVEVVKVES